MFPLIFLNLTSICANPYSTYILSTGSSLCLFTSKNTQQKHGQIKNCSDQNKLKKTAPCPTGGSVEEPFAAEVVGARSEFKKHIDMMKKKITGDY